MDRLGQVPQRAVDAGLIDRFGAIDDKEGGTTQRQNLNLTYEAFGRNTQFTSQIYFVNYRFKLFSNFTFFLEDPVNGDEIEQDDNRNFIGYNGQYAINHEWLGVSNKTTFGVSFRSDDIENSLWKTVEQEREYAKAQALVHERASSVFAKHEIQILPTLRADLGVRTDYFIFDVEDLLPTDSTHTNYSGYNFQSLVSPKANLIFTPVANAKFFANAGMGFHSNDARSSVQDRDNHRLPRSIGGEVGTQLRLFKRLIVSAALWNLELENEIVYVGDDGTTEDKGSSRRYGVDIVTRLQIARWLFFDADFNLSRNYLTTDFGGDVLPEAELVPLAPTFSSTGGFTTSGLRHWEAALRYRYLGDRPANETNSVVAEGYFVVDAAVNYTQKRFSIGLQAENILNTEWNEAQFDTESRLFDEAESVSELHFTPGTPLALKTILRYTF